ncbi:unnamed protein product [Mytilus coruscus]|uniref:HMCN n=1 Tax=Mytilus coruscus TaxID=42192 RepID=A0A6J8CJY9_MYTCO|nr:unnamed protein product [Mytilus coruscus]
MYISDVDCYTTNNNGSSYVGTVHTSRLNHPCLNWQTVNSQLVSYHENHTFCRNPNEFGEPWCYTGTLNNGFENCDVSMCAKHQLQVSPSITATSEVEVNYYADAKLVCNVTGYPTPRIKWKFTYKTLPSTSSTLILLRATNEKAGIYTCIATNDVGASQADIKLKVTFDTPKIVSPLLTTICKTGESYNFTCIATGHPSPEISWSFYSYIHWSSAFPRHVKFNNDTVVQLVNIQESGVLYCTATNEFGTDHKSVHVIVRHKNGNGEKCTTTCTKEARIIVFKCPEDSFKENSQHQQQ